MNKTKIDKCGNLKIFEIRPISTQVVPNGGISIDWGSDAGWGNYALMWGEDGKLHADTEHMDKTDKRFTEAILKLLVSEIIIDE